jgi:hypothetical protein
MNARLRAGEITTNTSLRKIELCFCGIFSGTNETGCKVAKSMKSVIVKSKFLCIFIHIMNVDIKHNDT